LPLQVKHLNEPIEQQIQLFEQMFVSFLNP